ncbi:hypothetical protein FSP39_005356 [Pinctada imbricata]|uniref:Arrestin C-terminal-like domain-containing protein n=1 Tax=Pinctada imbricata TaxID=66713 RepID=A0AA88XCI5_PINIB|nr:hypothetical protein FSP39_005356 [Pinctada imbricata]
MELDDVHPVITPLSHEEEFSYDFNNKDNGRPHYKQNQSNFTNISPRAAKYRDSKLKLPRHITVPQAAGSTRVSSAGQMSRSHSPSQHGSMRGHPTTPNNVMSRNSSGTIKSLHSGFHGSIRGLSSGDGTLRIYQHEALSPGGGFRSNHLPQGSAVPKVPNSFASVAMRRRVRKEDYVTHFAVELDLHERHRYCPGEEIGGKIVFDVSGKLEIRFIEFQIIGQTLLSFARKGYHGPKSLKDTFLCKRSYVVGTPDGKWGSVVTPGHYVSKFRFRLPEGLPSSLRYKDDSNGFGTEISYKVKARICDDLGSSSIRSTHSVQNYVKILMTRQVSFTVKRPFDIHSIPMALTPVVHTEELCLSTCSFFSPDLTTFSLSLDRSCFLAGDEIKVRLQISNFTKQIEKIRGELQQNVTVHKPKFHLTFTIADFEQTDTKGTLTRDNKQLYELAMPTRIGVLPSINPGCRMFTISYNLQVVIHFSSCGGQLTLDVPIRIGPCTDPVNLEKKNSVPVFNRPMRFPYFSLHENGKIQNGHVQNHVQPIRAAVKSSHSRTNSSVFCCWGPDTLM